LFILKKYRPTNGRPPEIPEEGLLKIRKELSEKSSGWLTKENRIFYK